jgi:hypothetical protein
MIPLATVNFLFDHRVPQRVLDIGSQNMLRASKDDFLTFLRKHGKAGDHEAAAAQLADRSITRPGHETLYLSELLDHTPIEYVSFDICPGRKTEIMDLNREKLRWWHKNAFDLILNCGTSEHILNQMNVFKVMHDAAKAGAYIYNQVPTTGRIDHGYFCYHPRLFRELAKANEYELLDIWYKRGFKSDPVSKKLMPRYSRMADTGIELRGKSDGPMEIPNHAVCVLFRKTHKVPFRFPLEIETRHAEPDPTRVAYYSRFMG